MSVPTLKELREAAGWSQRELAEKIGVSTNTVTRWEMGKRDDPSNAIAPRGPARKLLGIVFGVDPETITYGGESPNSE